MTESLSLSQMSLYIYIHTHISEVTFYLISSHNFWLELITLFLLIVRGQPVEAYHVFKEGKNIS